MIDALLMYQIDELCVVQSLDLDLDPDFDLDLSLFLEEDLCLSLLDLLRESATKNKVSVETSFRIYNEWKHFAGMRPFLNN